MSNWIIGFVIAGVVVVGGSYALMPSLYSLDEGGATVATGDVTGDGTDNAAAKVMDKSTPKLMEKVGFRGSWTDLVQRGGTYTCTFDSASAVSASTGVVYVSGTDVRGDFTSQTAAGTVVSSMLKKSDMVYVWGAGMPQGIKMQATMMEQGAGAPMQNDVVDARKAYSWECSPTAGDPSVFAVPTNITFMDIAKMMEGMGAMPGR